MIQRCPLTTAELAQASRNISCTDKGKYHCLRNQKGILVQKCLTSSWIQKEYCAEYNSIAGKIDAEKCNETLGLCPQKTYLSNEVISYSACVKSTNTGYSSPSIPSITDELYSNSTTAQYTQAAGNSNGKTDMTLLYGVICAFIMIIAVVTIVIVIWWKRRRRSNIAKAMEKRCSADDNDLQKSCSSVQSVDQEIVSETSSLVRVKADNEETLPTANEKVVSGLAKKGIIIGKADRLQQKSSETFASWYKGICFSGDTTVSSWKDMPFFDDRNYKEPLKIEELDNILLSKQNILIVGKPGSGKTSLAWHSCLKYLSTRAKQKPRALIGVRDPSELKITSDSEIIRVVLIKTLEASLAFPANWNYDIAVIKELISSERKRDLQVIMTASTAVFEEISAKEPDFLAQFTLFKTDDVKNALTHEDLRNILKAHGLNVCPSGQMQRDYYIDEDKLMKLKSDIEKNPIGFPLAASLFAKDNVLRTRGTSAIQRELGTTFTNFFKNSFTAVKDRVTQLRKSTDTNDKDHYCTLIFTMLSGGYFGKEDNFNPLLQEIASKIGHTEPKLCTDSFLLHMKDKNTHEFCHEKLLQIVFVEAGEQWPGFLIEKCDMNTLCRYARTERKKYFKDGFLIVDDDHFITLLLQRLLGEGVDVKSHVIWTDVRIQELSEKIRQQK